MKSQLVDRDAVSRVVALARTAPAETEVATDLIAFVTGFARLRGTAPAGIIPPEEFLLRFGRVWPANAQSFTGARMTPRQCYGNAANMALHIPALTYVEGYCHNGLIPFMHAWVVTREGFVIDPTLREKGEPEDFAYLGVPFRRDYLQRTLLRKKTYGLLDIDNRQIYKISEKTLRTRVVKRVDPRQGGGTPQSKVASGLIG